MTAGDSKAGLPRLLVASSVGSMFLSAFLLFSVQPLSARLLLPRFGGSPAVWNTSLVLFQTLLVGGYLYAHRMSRWATRGRRWWLHAALLLLPLLVLPIAVPDEAIPSATPMARLLLAQLVMVGAPFFVLSTNASLVQHWWSTSGARDRDDPYWLYAASNTGSLLALLSYSFVIEPFLTVRLQTKAWMAGYVAFVALTLVALFGAGAGRPAPPELTDVAPAPSILRKAGWAARAAIGTSLLLSLSMQISSDLAPVPLLWVVPLALYLVTFIVAFAPRTHLPRERVAAATVVTVMTTVGLLVVQGRHPLWLALPVWLATLFFGALLCHRDLYVARPAATHLTSFYLWLAIGGAVGGVLSSVFAPLAFDSVAELPLTLIALCGVLYVVPDDGAGDAPRRSRVALGGPLAIELQHYRPTILVGALAGIGFLIPIAVAARDLELPAWSSMVALALAIGWGWGLSRRSWATVVSVVFPCIMILSGAADPGTIAQRRSFFGVVKVRDVGDAVEMIHGTTVHGRQKKADELRQVPGTYYFSEGPLGSLVARAPNQAHIGVVGLGTGALAAAGKPGQRMVFYELDPVVVELARRHFTYLADSPASVEVVVADGGIALRETTEKFDLLIIDAFSSDFVPAHLLTDSALTAYLQRLRSRGLLALHISNRHSDLRRVLKGYADAHGLPLWVADYHPDAAAEALGATPTLAAVMSHSWSQLHPLRDSPSPWQPVPEHVEPVRWTDDHTDLLSVLR